MFQAFIPTQWPPLSPLHGNFDTSSGSMNKCLLVLGKFSGPFRSQVLCLGSSPLGPSWGPHEMTYKLSVWSHSLLSLTESWSWSYCEVVFTAVWQGMVMPRRKWNSPLLGPCWSGWSPVYKEAKFSDFPAGESKSLIQPKRQKPHGWNSKTKIIKIEVTGSLNFPPNIRISPIASWMGDQPGSSWPESSRKNQAVYSLLYAVLIPSPVNCMLNQIYLW